MTEQQPQRITTPAPEFAVTSKAPMTSPFEPKEELSDEEVARATLAAVQGLELAMRDLAKAWNRYVRLEGRSPATVPDRSRSKEQPAPGVEPMTMED